MKNLVFDRLLVLSNSEKSGNVFQFQNKRNLITATENSVGKSTVAKLLLWGVGCEPTLDETWRRNDCRVIVDFRIQDSGYRIMRYKNQIRLQDKNGDLIGFDKISGSFSSLMADILEFKARLPNAKNPDILETPPPGYYFLPFYVDQIRSWHKPWEGFEKLQQYSRWKPTIIKYHVGILPPEYFAIAEEKFVEKEKKTQIDDQVDRITTAIEVVDTYAPSKDSNFVSTVPEFITLTETITETLAKLAGEQELLLSELASIENEKSFLEHQRLIAVGVVRRLEDDYQFTVEHIPGVTLECPLCATIHENTAVNRASILADKQSAQDQLDKITSDLENLGRQIELSRIRLSNVREQIEILNGRFIVADGTELNVADVVQEIAVKRVKEKAEDDRKERLSDQKHIDEIINRLEREQKKTQKRDRTQSINSYFAERLTRYARILNADVANLSNINKPVDYAKLEREGGAADHTRLTLAYTLAIYSVISRYGSGVLAPLIIDTPNQQEQSDSNYHSILSLVLNDFADDSQLILCAMKNEHLEPFLAQSNVIEMNSSKILDKSKFIEVKRAFDDFEQQFEVIQNQE